LWGGAVGAIEDLPRVEKFDERQVFYFAGGGVTIVLQGAL
jgi:hypothetical protein